MTHRCMLLSASCEMVHGSCTWATPCLSTSITLATTGQSLGLVRSLKKNLLRLWVVAARACITDLPCCVNA